MIKALYCKTVCLVTLIFTLLCITPAAYSLKGAQEIYQLKIYHSKSSEQINRVDDYLENAYLPALHRAGVKKIGVFKPIANDTATEKSIYVLITYNSADAWLKVDKLLSNDAGYKSAGKSFIEAPAAEAPFQRMESVLLEAFTGQPRLVLPPSKNAERVFELRSYESPTEHLYEKKEAMFNTGGEIPIFNRLGFNPVFYAKVLAGSRMPNFMYMPVFESVEKRNAQWKVFGDDAAWKDISTRPENENKESVSHIDSILMHSTEYSDF